MMRISFIRNYLTRKWPNDPTLWFNFGVVSKEKGDLDGALRRVLTKAAELTKQMPEGGIFKKARLRG